MKIIKISCLVLFAIIFAIPANSSVTKCIKPPSASATCAIATENGYADFLLLCPDTGIISGVGACSNTNGVTVGNTYSGDLMTREPDQNIYCWCKMTIPAVSHWVFARTFDNGGDCAARCGVACGSNMQRGGNFRTAIFSNLKAW